MYENNISRLFDYILTGNEATIEGESRYTKFLPNPAPPFFCLLTRTVHRSTQRYSYTA